MLLTVCSLCAQTSWSASNSGLPAVCNILDMATANDGSIYCIVSVVNDKAYIYKSVDKGSSWNEVNQSGLPQWFHAIESVGSDLLVGTCNEGSYLYRSSDNGLNWSTSSNGLPTSSKVLDFAVNGTMIDAIVSIDQDKAYLYQSTNNGTSWSLVNETGLPTWFRSIAYYKGNWYVGTEDDGDVLYRSSNDGVNWEVYNAGLPLSCFILSFSVCRDNLYALVSIANDKAYIYKYNHSGSIWTELSVSGLPGFYDCFGSVDNALLAGTWEAGDILYKSDDLIASISDNVFKTNEIKVVSNQVVLFSRLTNVKVYNLQGALVNTATNVAQFELDALKPGVYLIQTDFGIKKVVKQ
jgi:hypothetical protein